MRMFLGLKLAVLVGVVAVAEDQSKPKGVEAALERRLPEVTFRDVPLETVMDYLGEQTGIDVRVDWEALSKADVRRETPVTLSGKNLRVSQVYWLALDEARRDAQLVYRAKDDALVITTAEDPSTPRATADGLKRRLPEMTFVNTPLETVLDYLSEQSGVGVTIDWEALSKAGVRRDTPVTLCLVGPRVSQAIWLALDEAGGDVELAYRQAEDRLEISTAEKLESTHP